VKTIAIHQPNFFPWLGYFEKIVRSDAFVFLDHVQYQKTGGTWSNRVKLLINGDAKWVTAPINRAFNGVRAVREIEFLSGVPWRDEMLKLFTQQYSKAPFFAETMELLAPLLLNPENNIAVYNSQAIVGIAVRLGVRADKFYWSSKLPFEGHANELLISLVRSLGGTAYLCGGGAAGYQDDLLFHNAGVEVCYQNFRPHPYPQPGLSDFVPGLSIVDALMNQGVQAVAALIGKRC
jgi:hypothetical protein